MTKKERAFVETVTDFYVRHGRGSLPWRTTKDPYKILVSEIMLQQTQVERVKQKYTSFLKQFPSVKHLALAPLGDVLVEWQGLGYNRRAKMLHETAKAVMGEYRGHFPRTYDELLLLPGVGPYTAGAVMAFAYETPIPIIETNIRTAYLHHFFSDKTDVDDAELMSHIIETLDLENPREWYYALMDYGSHLKKTLGNPNSRSKHYTKQSTFKDSDREIRGAIVRALSADRLSRKKLHTVLPFAIERIDAQLERLKEEGMVSCKSNEYSLPT